MNENLNSVRQAGEMYEFIVCNEGNEEEIITLGYETKLKDELMDIIRLLAKRGYIIKIKYIYTMNDDN